MKAKLIKTEADYEAALARLDAIFEAEPGTPAGDEAELLTALIELYEEKAYPMEMPTPLEAIQFRMEQEGLKNKDLIPFIGSPSKVSEVMSGKRALSLTMIRKLVAGLGIPAEVLIGQAGAELRPESAVSELKKYPVAEMLRRGWFAGFTGTLAEAKDQLEDLFASFIRSLGVEALRPALNRQHVRHGGRLNDYALAAWRIRVMTLAMKDDVPPYQSGTVNEEFLARVAQLSYLDEGPRLAREFLNKNGIHFVIERHLPGTHLDGAAMKMPDGSPLVALTLRHDRLDNFWFTLFHELAHVARHLDQDGYEAFFDDLDEQGRDRCEKEADAMAREALIPARQWKASGLAERVSAESVLRLANQLHISAAIPAGRARYEKKNYAILKNLIGQGKVRRLFMAA